MTNAEAIAITKARANMYRFLGGLYVMEVDEEQLTLLKQMQFPEITGEEDADLDFKEGYALMRGYLSGITADDLEDLAADFAKVFLAAGDASGRAAFPYESVYVNKKHQIGGSTEMQMKALYLERGWEPDPNVFRTMEDNIGLILEFLGILCEEEVQALEAEDVKKASDLMKEQRKLLKKHVLNWVYSFTSDVVKFADRDFYKSVAKITNGFIKKETEFLQKGGAAWDIA